MTSRGARLAPPKAPAAKAIEGEKKKRNVKLSAALDTDIILQNRALLKPIQPPPHPRIDLVAEVGRGEWLHQCGYCALPPPAPGP